MIFESLNIKKKMMNDFLENVATVGSGLVSFIVLWVKGIVVVNEAMQVFMFAAAAALGGLTVKFILRLITWGFRRFVLKDKTTFFKYKL